MNKLSKKFKYLLIGSLAFNLLIIFFFIGKRIHYYRSGLPEKRADVIALKGYNQRFNKQALDLFKILPHDTTDIVFLGTSLTRNFPLQEFFKNCRLENRGIIGNTITDMIGRLSEITDGRPSKIFIEAGTNDIGDNPNNITLQRVVKIITTIQSKTPRTKIYVQSVLPFGTTYTPKIEAYNYILQKYCLSKNIPFINLYPYFLGNKALKKELTIDDTHLTAKGYLIWGKILKPYL
jgi:lysophospholipase L1-like esterase